MAFYKSVIMGALSSVQALHIAEYYVAKNILKDSKVNCKQTVVSG